MSCDDLRERAPRSGCRVSAARGPSWRLRSRADPPGVSRPRRSLWSASRWLARPRSSSAPTAATSPRSGTASAPPARRGTRSPRSARRPRAPGRGRGGGGGRGLRAAGPAGRPVPLREVSADRAPRLATGIGELDRLLGGGLVPGSLVLLGGSPGIGKSTLTTMALGLLQGAGRSTLYVSGEESPAQIRLRAERLEGGAAPGALDVPVLAETDLDTVVATIAAERPDVCVDRLRADARRERPDRARPGRSDRCARSRRGSWTSPSATAPPCCSSAT